jgi:hypothetical protein
MSVWHPGSAWQLTKAPTEWWWRVAQGREWRTWLHHPGQPTAAPGGKLWGLQCLHFTECHTEVQVEPHLLEDADVALHMLLYILIEE